jgi:predicted nucleic acid-binding protein
MPDALIAATTIYAGASLLTLNKEDYKFIKGLKLK